MLGMLWVLVMMTRGIQFQQAATSQRPAQDSQQHPTTSTAPGMALSRMRKAELKAKLLELGEETPTKWTNKEIIMRILELDPTADQKTPSKRTDLQERIRALGIASKKKDTLVEFCHQIGINVNPNATKYSLEQGALRKLYDLATPAAEDVVGFGKYSTETYEGIRSQRPQYARWVRQTARETEETDYRLRRLATWLETQDNEEQEMIKDIDQKKKKEGGYHKVPTTVKESDARASTEMPTVLLQNMMETIQNLQQEVQEMRAERPRKEVRAPSTAEGSEKSFQMVTQPPP